MTRPDTNPITTDMPIAAIRRWAIPEGHQIWRASDRHRFLFPLHGHRATAICERDGMDHEVEMDPNGCIPVPAGIEPTWNFSHPWAVVVIEIVPERLQAFTRNELKTLIVGNRIGNRIVLADRDLARLARRLDESARETGIGQAILHDALCRIFLVTMVQHYAVEDTDGGQFSGRLSVRQFRSLQDYIATRISGPIRVAEMAARVGMSEAVFARELKASVGETPARFVLRARVRMARRLLIETSEPIGHIAAACGFSDQAHLARSFRQQMGQSPLAFRQAAAMDADDLPQDPLLRQASRASPRSRSACLHQADGNVQISDRSVQSEMSVGA